MRVDHIVVLILAAGQSTRFGGQKMHHLLAGGKTVLQTCIEQYQSVFSNVTVVINTDFILKHTLAELEVNIVVANNADKGMSQSLVAGIQSQVTAGAWLIGLGDMPYVKTATLEKLAGQSTQNKIVVPVCGDRQGNPVIFACEFKDQLLSLKGDVGAKQLLDVNASQLVEVNVDDTGVLHDIDRLEDVL